MTPAGIELATFRFVAQHVNHCATAVPRNFLYWRLIFSGPQSGTCSMEPSGAENLVLAHRLLKNVCTTSLTINIGYIPNQIVLSQ